MYKYKYIKYKQKYSEMINIVGGNRNLDDYTKELVKVANEINYNDRLAACNNNLGSSFLTKQIDEYLNVHYELHNFTKGSITVIRHDLLCGGTKSLISMDHLLEDYPEHILNFVYITTPYGGAQVALAWTIKELNLGDNKKRKAIIFTEGNPNGEQDKAYTRMAKELDAEMIFIPGNENIVAKAKKYVDENKNSVIVPNGFTTPKNISRLAKILKKSVNAIIGTNNKFDASWCATASGGLIRSLQEADIANKYYGLCVYQQRPTIMGNGIPVFPEKGIAYPVAIKDMPTYPSSAHYDGKVWSYAKNYAIKNNYNILIVNVM